MRKKLFFFLFLGCGLFLLFPPSAPKNSLLTVFRVTEEPVAITRGAFGSVLTVNISFGDAQVEEWIQELKKPYPLLFVDTEWASRFPETVRLINEKNIPVGLLGKNGEAYEQDAALLVTELEQFKITFGTDPLWFRTLDEVFPTSLHMLLWEVELNPLGSSFIWKGGAIPSFTEGEIISVPHHRTNRVNFIELKKLAENRDFQTIEDVLFGSTVKTKKIPK